MKFCYIVLHYRDSRLTNRCIESVRKNINEHDAIIIVDASHDLMLLDPDGIHVVKPYEYNPGFSRGMNIGAQRAVELGSQIFAFINNDTVLGHDFGSMVVNAFRSGGNEVAAVAPKIVYMSQPNLIWSAGGRISKRLMKAVQEKQFHVSEDVRGMTTTKFLSGCVICIRGSVFKQIGGWPEAYFFGGEEWELSHLLSKKGYEMVLCADTSVLHEADFDEGQGSSHSFSDLRFVINSYYNRLLFARRNFGIFATLWFRVRLIFHIILVLPVKWRSIGPFKRAVDKLYVSWLLANLVATRPSYKRINSEELSEAASKIKRRMKQLATP